jgi:hypothetical protein
MRFIWLSFLDRSLFTSKDCDAPVENELSVHQRLSAAKTPQEQTALTRQITATDTQIDRLVYDLYGLTEDEIRIVEGATP